VDVDGEVGRENWKKLKAKRIAKTVAVVTGRGYHLYFAANGLQVANSTGKLGAGIDIRGEGGYVVGPGSIHESGGRYEYAYGLGPSSVEVAPLPAWLAELIIDRNVAGDAPAAEVKAVLSEAINEGHRNERLTRLAGELQNSGISVDALTAALRAENQTRCQPPLEDSEVQKIAQSVARYIPKLPNGDAAQRLCQTVLNERFSGGTSLLYAIDGRFWAFEGTHWKPLPRKVLGGIVLSFIEAMQTVKRTNALALIQQTVGLLEARTATSQDILRFRASPPNVINCRNGELWISQEGSVSLQPHRPESYLTHCIETEYGLTGSSWSPRTIDSCSAKYAPPSCRAY
jgi:hypothetical protein